MEKAKETGKFLGLFYDETEHLQLHPEMYTQNHRQHSDSSHPSHQWASTEGKNPQDIENNIVEAVRERIQNYGGDVSLYTEQVFPVMYHIFARGGFNLCPKVMKEEFQSLQLATALGAAK